MPVLKCLKMNQLLYILWNIKYLKLLSEINVTPGKAASLYTFELVEAKQKAVFTSNWIGINAFIRCCEISKLITNKDKT